MIKEELIMEKYFDNVKVDWEELERQKKEMQNLIEIGRKNKEAYLKMMDDLNRQLEKLVEIKERY